MFSRFISGATGHGQLLLAHVEMSSVQKATQRMLATVEGKAATKALAAVGKFSQKKVKAEIPTRYKGVRKAIRWRHVKRKYNAGGRAVKVGGGVGPNLLRKNMTGRGRKLTASQQAKAEMMREKIATSQKNRKDSKRPGVGIDGNNVHWWFLGTDERMTGTKRKRIGGKKGRGGWRGKDVRVDTGKPKMNRGRMPAQTKPIIVILASNSGGIKEIIRTHLAKDIAVEGNKNTQSRDAVTGRFI